MHFLGFLSSPVFCDADTVHLESRADVCCLVFGSILIWTLKMLRHVGVTVVLNRWMIRELVKNGGGTLAKIL